MGSLQGAYSSWGEAERVGHENIKPEFIHWQTIQKATKKFHKSYF